MSATFFVFVAVVAGAFGSPVLQDLSDLERDIASLERQKDVKVADVNHALNSECKFDATEADQKEFCDDDEAMDDRGNYFKYTKAEDLSSLAIYQQAIAHCAADNGDGGYTNDLYGIIKALSTAPACPITSEDKDGNKNPDCETYADKDRFAVTAWKYPHCTKKLEISDDGCSDSDKDCVNHCGIGLGPDGWVEDGKADFRICEGGGGANSMPGGPGQTHLKDLIDKHDGSEASCRKLYEASSSDAGGVFKLLDNVVCQEPIKEGSLCDDAEAWYRKFMSGKMVGVKKGRVSKGEDMMTNPDGSNDRTLCQSKYRLAFSKFKSIRAGITEDLKPNSCFSDEPELLGGTPNSIFSQEHPAGKKAHLPGNNVNYAYFANCQAPFLAGVSGTIAQFLRVVGGQVPINLGKMLILISMTELGGHHSLTELIIAAKSFFEFDNVDLFDDVVTPFDYDANITPMSKYDNKLKDKDSCVRNGDLTDWQGNGAPKGGSSAQLNPEPDQYLFMMETFDAVVAHWKKTAK